MRKLFVLWLFCYASGAAVAQELSSGEGWNFSAEAHPYEVAQCLVANGPSLRPYEKALSVQECPWSSASQLRRAQVLAVECVMRRVIPEFDDGRVTPQELAAKAWNDGICALENESYAHIALDRWPEAKKARFFTDVYRAAKADTALHAARIHRASTLPADTQQQEQVFQRNLPIQHAFKDAQQQRSVQERAARDATIKNAVAAFFACSKQAIETLDDGVSSPYSVADGALGLCTQHLYSTKTSQEVVSAWTADFRKKLVALVLKHRNLSRRSQGSFHERSYKQVVQEPSI